MQKEPRRTGSGEEAPIFQSHRRAEVLRCRIGGTYSIKLIDGTYKPRIGICSRGKRDGGIVTQEYHSIHWVRRGPWKRGSVDDFILGTEWKRQGISSNWPVGNSRTPFAGEYLSGLQQAGIKLTIEKFQIKDTFSGLEYLHTRNPPICHGDLKSVSSFSSQLLWSLLLTSTTAQLNILVSASYRAIITDFGSARVLNHVTGGRTEKSNDQKAVENLTVGDECRQIHLTAAGNRLTLTGPAWSLRWAPPEVVNGNCPDLSSDVWAAGWVCWEVG